MNQEKKKQNGEVSWPVGPDATYHCPITDPENGAAANVKEPRYG